MFDSIINTEYMVPIIQHYIYNTRGEIKMAKFEYTEDMVARMEQVCAGGITEDIIVSVCEEFDFPRRSVTAKLRKLGFDVPTKPKAAPAFDETETSQLVSFLETNSGEHTAEEIAAHFANAWGREVNARQVNGKALSLEMTGNIKPADKKVAPRTYTEAEEATIAEMVENGSFLEDIADSLGKTVNSVRGKLLSMQIKAPQRDKKATKTDAYEGIAELATSMTVAQLAEHFAKSERGVKTVLTRRGIVASDYTPKALEA
jgi:MarR-like DNA-binding transcriptional regulator SgrR of sgrS sRNA